MTRAGRHLLGASALALCALVAAMGTVGASSVQPPVARYVEPARTAGQFVRVAGLFGESDEEKAARLQHEQNQDDAINRLNDKVHDLEDSVRNLTGQNEDLAHRIQMLDDKIDRQQRDFEYRLCTLAAQQLGAGTGGQGDNSVPCQSGGSSTSGNTTNNNSSTSSASGGNQGTNLPPLTPSANQQVTDPPGAPRRLAPGPGVLGTLPANAANNPVTPPPAADDPHAQFNNAMNLLAKARYDEASAAFRSFADTHPHDDLTPQAIYWIGDIAYVQKDYASAARSFAEVIKKYPTSTRAPDSMLKLGQALIASGQKQEGCTALAALPAKYPHAPAAVLSQGADARKAVCRHIS